MSSKTESEENGPVEESGTVDAWEALDPRDRTERSIVERIFRRVLEDVRVFQKDKKPTDER